MNSLSSSILDQCLYFGVWDKTNLGHSLHKPNGQTIFERDNNRILPFPYTILDGLFFDQEQSKVYLVHLKGWTILWCADRSGDSRGRSCSAFLAPEEYLNFNEMKERFSQAFPDQFNRIEILKPLFIEYSV